VKPPRPYIHPATPSKLITAFRNAQNRNGQGWKINVLAARLHVNVGYLHKLIKHGIEPPDDTDKGQAARVAMFLPRHKRQTKRERTKLPEFMRWWRRIPKEIRHDIIIKEFTNNNKGS